MERDNFIAISAKLAGYNYEDLIEKLTLLITNKELSKKLNT